MEESQKIMKVHVYYCHENDCINQKPKESDEMKPEWFTFENIPFEKMWPDDPYWMNFLLNNKKFIGRFDYSDDNTIVDYDLKEQ